MKDPTGAEFPWRGQLEQAGCVLLATLLRRPPVADVTDPHKIKAGHSPDLILVRAATRCIQAHRKAAATKGLAVGCATAVFCLLAWLGPREADEQQIMSTPP